MKKTTTNPIAIGSTITLKAIQQELKAILEDDIRKFTEPQYTDNKNAAFLQLISA